MQTENIDESTIIVKVFNTPVSEMESLNRQNSSKDIVELFNWILWTSTDYFRRRQWQYTPVLLPGKSHGQRSLVDCSPWGR